jgi:hypothetical protein
VHVCVCVWMGGVCACVCVCGWVGCVHVCGWLRVNTWASDRSTRTHSHSFFSSSAEKDLERVSKDGRCFDEEDEEEEAPAIDLELSTSVLKARTDAVRANRFSAEGADRELSRCRLIAE